MHTDQENNMHTDFKRGRAALIAALLSALMLLAACSGPGARAASDNTAAPSGTEAASDNNTAPSGTEAAAAKPGFAVYLDLLGLDRDELIDALGEEPESIDEGGLEFKKAGIRVWFDQDAVSQIFTQRQDIDFNGAKIGDKIDAFKKAFGEPVSDQNGDMHFKYGDNAYISVNYDTDTGETFAVYLLSEDF